MEKVIAVVVTYNRKKLLSECITALNNQTKKLDAILVVNNGSTDDTEVWLASQKNLFTITQKNVGSSGGFNTAINWAYKNGYSWIWCMDDNGYPKEDALEKILEPRLDILCLRNCAVLNKEDKKTFVWKTRKYATIDAVDIKIITGVGHPFNGTMLNRNIVERVGLPKSKLFLWGDETEYFWRIVKRNSIPVCTISDSIHYRPAAGITFKNDWNYYTTWKMYFYIRNRIQIYNAKYNYKLTAFVNYCCFLIAMAGAIMVYQKTDKFKKLGFIFWPAIDAFSNNYHATPQTTLARLNAPAFTSINQALKPALRNISFAVANPFSKFRRVKTANA